jgi:hypothetical protein
LQVLAAAHALSSFAGSRREMPWQSVVRHPGEQMGVSNATCLVYRDRKRARACVDRLLAWPFEQVVLAHGEPLTDNAHAQVRAGLAWL